MSYSLRRLPKEDFNQAIDYFEEYFAEAGEENEQQAIEDLGSPEDAAKELIMNLAEKNMEQPPKTVKHSFKAVWIGILGICAAPIALPIALSLICVIAAVIVSVFCVFAGLFLTAVTLAGAAVIGVIGGAALLIQSLPDGLATLGFSLCCGAVGIMSVYGIFCFLKWLLYKVAQLLGKIMKGGKKNEKITKRILIASAVTAGTGVVFMGVGIALGGWPGVVFTKGGIHSPYEQKTPYRQEKKEIEPFSELSLYVGSEADVVVMASKDEKYYVEYTLDGNYGKPKCELTNGKLSIAQQDHNGYMTGMFGLNLGENLSGENLTLQFIFRKERFLKPQIYTMIMGMSTGQMSMEKSVDRGGQRKCKNRTVGNNVNETDFERRRCIRRQTESGNIYAAIGLWRQYTFQCFR